MQNNPNNSGNRPPYPTPNSIPMPPYHPNPNSLPPMPHFPHQSHQPHQFPFPPPPFGFPAFPPQIPFIPAPSVQATIPSGLTSAAAPVELGQPNRTLYLQNLPERPNPHKHLPPLLKDLFSAFGPLKRPPILRKGTAMNGQAWIIFKKQSDADAALKALQGTRIWGKSLVIRYARFRSDCVILEKGADKDSLEVERKLRESDRIEKAKTPRQTRRQVLTRLMSGNPTALQSVSISGPDVLLPNRLLFIQNIPPGMSTSPVLADMFRRYPGFQDLRPVPNRPDVAFVEYETEVQAGVARVNLDRSELGMGNILRVSFARR